LVAACLNAGLDCVKYHLAHVFVARLVYVDERHAKRLCSSYDVTVNVGVVPSLHALLELLDCLPGYRFWDAMLYHVFNMPVKDLVKIDRRYPYRVVRDDGVAPKVSCKHQFCRANVYGNQDLPDVPALHVHGTVCRHLFPSGKVQPDLHYLSSVKCHCNRSKCAAKFKSDLAFL
jgi:hypothetical protein